MNISVLIYLKPSNVHYIPTCVFTLLLCLCVREGEGERDGVERETDKKTNLSSRFSQPMYMMIAYKEAHVR